MDQAEKLRKDVNEKDLLESQHDSSAIKTDEDSGHDAKVITISSGKGGVGKTSFTVNLALALANDGKRVTVIDADLGLANIDVLMGIMPKHTLIDVLRDNMSIEDIVVKGHLGINVVSGGSGIRDLVDLSQEQLDKLIKAFRGLNGISDYILIDTGAGISNSVVSFLSSSDDIIIVVTPDPTSITDAYALIKSISGDGKSIKLVVNRVDSNSEGDIVFEKMSVATKRFLGIEIESLGYIYEDNCVKKAVRSQSPLMLSYPNSVAAKGMNVIAFNIINNSKYMNKVSSFNRFLNKLFSN